LNPSFVTRGLVLDVAGLGGSRRLRAVVDAFFARLREDSALKDRLGTAFLKLPEKEIDKAMILGHLDRLVQRASESGLINGEDAARLKASRDLLQQSLPQLASVRQIAFFLYLNNVLQPRMLGELQRFEEARPNGYATPNELADRALELMAPELERTLRFLELVTISQDLTH